MAKEEVILDFKVEQGEAIKELEQTKVAIINLKKEQKDLNDQYKKGQISTEQYAKASVKLEGELKKNTTAYNENLKASKGVTTQFDKLVSSLSSSVPGFAGVQGGFSKITAGARAFIATPIGIVVTALSAAVGALTAYFKGSEEGQNDWNKVVKVGTVVLGNLLDIVRDFGSVLVKFFSGDLTGAADALSDAWDKTKNIVSETIDEINKGLSIEDLRAQTDVLERELIILRATNEARIADLKLKAEDKSLKLKERQDALNEALRLQNELSDKAVIVAKNRLTIKKEENSLSDSTKEDLKEEAELTANLALVEKDRADKSKEIVTKNQALKQEGIENDKKFSEERLKIFSAEIEAYIKKNKFEASLAEESKKRQEEELERLRERLGLSTMLTSAEGEFAMSVSKRNEELGLEADFTDEAAEANAAYQKETKKGADATSEANRNTQIFQQSLSSLTGVLKNQTAEQKALSASQALINTYLGATNVLTAKPPLPFPLNLIALATTIASGLAAVSQITKAAGGGSFETRGPQLMLVGDNPGGRERVDVTPISGRGQTRVGGGMIQMAGGGSIVANSSSSRIDTSFGSILKDMNLTVSWREGQELGNKVKFKEDLVTL